MSAALTAVPQHGVPQHGVVGYVEAVTAHAVVGWAWVTGSPRPLTVELRVGAEVVAEALADGLRDDLAQNGIGEGRHAFTIAVPEAVRGQLGELRVVVRTPDGDAVPLGTPAAEDGTAERLSRLNRGMEMLLGSQRVLHRNVQAALLAPPTADTTTLAQVAATQAALGEAVATLELFVARLELGMAGVTAQPAPPGSPRWALAGLAAVAGTALVLSAWALYRVMPG